MNTKLAAAAALRFTCGIALTALLLFLPAGSLHWWQAWLFMAVLFVPIGILGCTLAVKAPDLLSKRLNAREAKSDQRAVVALSGLVFSAAFLAAGLGFRLGAPSLPAWASFAGCAAFLAGYAMYAQVMKQNAYLSRTVEVQEGQQVVDTGLYGAVRHPMYAATLVLFLAMPVILGSAVSAVIMLAYVPLIVARIRGEERFLTENLPGYAEYTRRVKWRLVPHVW